jgi:RNA polymerase sigma-70 factor (ECF subfamily)
MLAQDLTSSVFEKAWRTRASFTEGSAKAWLYRIARTTLIDYWRRKKDITDEGTIDQAESAAAPLDEVLDREMRLAELEKAVRKLPKEMRLVVHYRFIERESSRQTAARLGLTEANVRVIQYRALKKLRGYMQ